MNVAAAIEERVDQALREEMQAILDELEERASEDAPTLPEAEHAERHPGRPPLKDSGYTALGVEEGAVIGVVGFRAFYAAWVHERRDWKHDDGKSGYLGDNLKAMVPEIRERLAAAVRRALE